MRPPGLVQLRADPQTGVQRGERTLQDQPDLAAAHLPHLALGQAHQRLPPERDLPACGSSPEGEQLQNRQGQGALARATLTNQSQNLARRDGEGGVADDARSSGIVDGEREAEQRIAGVHRGLAAAK